MIELITTEQQSVTAWAGGTTRELAISPAGSSLAARDFHWRFSSADVNASGAFSDFTGYQRYLAIRAGAGLQLRVDAHQMTLSSPRYVAVFAGHASTHGELVAGAVRDVNLIVRLTDDTSAGLRDVEFLPLQVPAEPLWLSRTQPRLWLVYADQGPLQLQVDGQQVDVAQGMVAKITAASLALSAVTPTEAVIAALPCDAA